MKTLSINQTVQLIRALLDTLEEERSAPKPKVSRFIPAPVQEELRVSPTRADPLLPGKRRYATRKFKGRKNAGTYTPDKTVINYRKKWSAAEDIQLVEALAQGQTFAQIARVFGRSVSSITSRQHELKARQHAMEE